MRQLLNETNKPGVHAGSRDALVQYRRLVESATKFVDVHRRLSAIDSRLRQPDTRYSSLVDDLHGLESLLSSLDDESSLERQALPVLQVTRRDLCVIAQFQASEHKGSKCKNKTYRKTHLKVLGFSN